MDDSLLALSVLAAFVIAPVLLLATVTCFEKWCDRPPAQPKCETCCREQRAEP
jgi:hypothetical protein